MTCFIHFYVRPKRDYYWLMGITADGVLKSTLLLEEAKAFDLSSAELCIKFMERHYGDVIRNIHVHTEREMLGFGEIPDRIRKLLKMDQ